MGAYLRKFRLLILLAAILPGFLPGRTASAADLLVEGDPVSIAAIADQQLGQNLGAIFERIESFRGLDVEVANGVVELRGQVPQFATAEKAVAIASRLEGVLYVVDKIEVQAELDSRLAPAWRKMSQVINNAVELIPLVGIALAIFAGVYAAGRLLTAWEWPYKRFENKVLLQNLVRQVIRYVFLVTGLLIALEILELTSLIGAFLGAAGLFGLALGFAFKDIVENYIAGFLLSIRSPFAFRDWIGVESHEGSVVRVTSRELVIMTLQGNHIRIPNSHVFKSVIYNYTRNPLRRFDIDIGVGVAEDLSRVQRVGCEVLEAMKGVVSDPAPSMRNQAFGESAMKVVFSGWVDQTAADFLKVRSEAVRLLKEALEQAAIEVPYPIQTVLSGHAESPHRAPAARGAGEEDLLQEAEHSDVGRDSHLDEQIRKDRLGSEEVDLLPP